MHPRILLVVATLLLVPLPSAAAPPGERDVIVQLFQWNWASVARECQDFLGPQGVGGVQVTPPQEHVVVAGSPWWQVYQPVSYKVDPGFATMVSACHSVGVKVYADAVINHMSGQNGPGTGNLGSAYDHYTYPGLYQTQDFHHCGRNGNDDIVNYNDRYEVQNCELVNLADLDTGSAYVRGRVNAYLKSLGVDGFRIDAAKHIPANDIAAMTSGLYVYQEVIFGAGEPITPEEYTGNGDVLEFRYGKDLAKIFNQEKLAYLRTFASPLPSAKAIVFTDNHDTQRGGGVLTFRDNARYALANAFMLAWPYGTPELMSSYEFTNPDQGPPAGDTTCFANGWRCEHRWQVIANMVKFHNAVRGTPITNWWDNGNDTIAFGRGTKGYLIINDESTPVTGRSFQTSLPAGTYTDVFHPTVKYTVDTNGWFRADIAAQDGLALHI